MFQPFELMQPGMLPTASDYNRLAQAVATIYNSVQARGVSAPGVGFSQDAIPTPWFLVEVLDRCLVKKVIVSGQQRVIRCEDCASGSAPLDESQEDCHFRYSWRAVWSDGFGELLENYPSVRGTTDEYYGICISGVTLDVGDICMARQGLGPWYELFPGGGGLGGSGTDSGGGGGISISGICTYPEKIQVRSGQVCCNDENGFYETHWYEVYAQDGSCQKWVFPSGAEGLADAIFTHQTYGGTGAIEEGQECPSEDLEE